MKRILLSLIAFVVLAIVLMFILGAIMPDSLLRSLASLLDIHDAEGITNLLADVTLIASAALSLPIVWMGNRRFR
ncbi:hypothetical protein [Serratia rhizosphaerae]|nr:hypothetical protein [Serratia rubidaea]